MTASRTRGVRNGGLAVLGLLLAGGAAGVRAEPATPLVTGSAHEALFAVALDQARVVAVGAGGEIVESGDAGRSWRAPAVGVTAMCLTGVVVRDGKAIAVGQEGTIARSDAAGAWTPADSHTKERLFAVSVNAAGMAVAVGSFGTILRSGDWGATWEDAAPDWTDLAPDGAQPHLYDVTVDDAGVVTIAGEFGLILRSADGRAWTKLHQGEASIFAMSFREGGAGFAAGQDGTVLRTRDGGATWQALETGTTAILLGVRSDAAGNVVVPGMHDFLVSQDDGATWTHLAGERFTASWFQGVADGGPGKPWIVSGHGGQLFGLEKAGRS